MALMNPRLQGQSRTKRGRRQALPPAQSAACSYGTMLAFWPSPYPSLAGSPAAAGIFGTIEGTLGRLHAALVLWREASAWGTLPHFSEPLAPLLASPATRRSCCRRQTHTIHATAFSVTSRTSCASPQLGVPCLLPRAKQRLIGRSRSSHGRCCPK